mmetsp:Transcript_24412/g.49834  ORF Transcript_24412/g.49834 Transcript_24412/m.49834 type:complete len:219 (+) Transcript_24412:863-1519(+)
MFSDSASSGFLPVCGTDSVLVGCSSLDDTDTVAVTQSSDTHDRSVRSPGSEPSSLTSSPTRNVQKIAVSGPVVPVVSRRTQFMSPSFDAAVVVLSDETSSRSRCINTSSSSSGSHLGFLRIVVLLVLILMPLRNVAVGPVLFRRSIVIRCDIVGEWQAKESINPRARSKEPPTRDAPVTAVSVSACLFTEVFVERVFSKRIGLPNGSRRCTVYAFSTL